MNQDKIIKFVKKAYEKSSFYKEHFQKAGIDVNKINSLEDFRKLPVIDKHDLLNNNPHSFRVCDESEIESVHSSGGTTARPKISFYDARFWRKNHKMVGRMCDAADIDKSSVVAILLPLDLAAAGHGMMRGILEKGACVIPFSLSTDEEAMIETLKKMKKLTHIITTPPMAVKIADMLNKHNIELDIRAVCVAGQPLTENVRKYVESELNTEVFDFFGVTEIGMMGTECKEHDWIHMFDDYYLLEVLDPETKEPVKEGEIGELHITSPYNESFVLIRYNLNDLVKFTTKKCKCGWSHPRFKFLGRNDGTLFLRHKLFKHQIDESLEKFGKKIGEYRLKVTKEGKKEILNFEIETNEDLKEKLHKALENVSVKIEHAVERGEMEVRVKIVPMGSLEKTARGKIKDQIVDKRKL